MAKKTRINYAELIHCQTPEEVRTRVRDWSSSLSDDDHLIRSTILDMHAKLEFKLRRIVFWQLKPLLGHFVDKDGAEASNSYAALERGVRALSFTSLQQVLQPVFESYGSSDIDHVWAVNDLRNQVAHGRVEKIQYKGRNPFRDHDSLAQVFFDSWAATQELRKFEDRRIDGPLLIMSEHEKACTLHYNCSKGLR